MKERLLEEKGSATVEATIWVPFVFFTVISLIVLSLQFMEMGIVQGEMLILSSNAIQLVDSERENVDLIASLEVQKQKIHFIENVDWTSSENKKEWVGQFRGTTDVTPRRKTFQRKTKVRKEHPIQIIRRYKQIGETISNGGV